MLKKIFLLLISILIVCSTVAIVSGKLVDEIDRLMMDSQFTIILNVEEMQGVILKYGNSPLVLLLYPERQLCLFIGLNGFEVMDIELAYDFIKGIPDFEGSVIGKTFHAHKLV